MDVRKKLMGLLQRAPYIRCEDVNRQYAVNWLMNNGVTVQEWISVTERLPTSDRIVLVFVRGYAEIGWYDGNHDEWRTGIATLDNCEVTHWMPLPEPPKEGAEG